MSIYEKHVPAQPAFFWIRFFETQKRPTMVVISAFFQFFTVFYINLCSLMTSIKTKLCYLFLGT